MVEQNLFHKLQADQISKRSTDQIIKPSSRIDPSENCELCPEDAEAMSYIKGREQRLSDLTAEITLFEHHIPDPNRTFTPEER